MIGTCLEYRSSRYYIHFCAVDACLGADALWAILKKDSDKKLYKMDEKIPVEWKVRLLFQRRLLQT